MRNSTFLTKVWFTQTLSFCGSVTLTFGTGIWIYEQIHQALGVALGTTLLYLPAVLLSKTVSRYEKIYPPEKILLVTNVGSLVLWVTLSMAIQVLKDELPLIYAALFIGGGFRAFQVPAMSLLIKKYSLLKLLQHNIGLFSLGNAGVNIVGPGILLLQVNGVRALLLFNIVSYPLIIVVLCNFFRNNCPKISGITQLTWKKPQSTIQKNIRKFLYC